MHGAHVVVAHHVRPMLLQHALALGVDFNLPLALQAGTLEAEIEATDAGEQRAERHAASHGNG
jgi:hypothetical protein